MDLSRRAVFVGKSAALWAVMALAVLCTALAALGFFTAAFLIWVSDYLGPAAAAAIAGVILLLAACAIAGGFTLVLRRMKARQPSMTTEAMGSLSLAIRLASLVVRRDPRKAMLAALIAGAVAEYFTSPRQPKG
ncbi:hypothetical protein [Acidocella sp.]|uniref:hypothetical protein n=1 Tax=Acidocella sp. TaxID=50710 RepID=UPI003D02451B